MANLLIVKNQGEHGNFSMIDSEIGDLMISAGSWQVFNSRFQVMKNNGGDLREYLRSAVSYRDDDAGTPAITFASDNALRNKLIEVRFLLTSSTTPPSSGTSWYNNELVYSGIPITVPTGFSGSVNNMDVPQNAVDITIAGTDLTINSGVSTGEFIKIYGIYPTP